MTIRRAKQHDTAALLRLLSQVLELHAALRPDIFRSGTTKYDAEVLAALLENEQTPIFVAVDADGAVLGYVFCAVWTPQGANLHPTLTLHIDGCQMAMVPFAATIPEGVRVYAVNDQLELTPLESIPAHTPVLVEARGEVAFTGSGEAGYHASPLTDMLRGTYTRASLQEGDYVLACQDGAWGFSRVTADDVLLPFGVYAQLPSTEAFLPLKGELSGVREMADTDRHSCHWEVYTLGGTKVAEGDGDCRLTLPAGIYIVRRGNISQKLVRK